MSGEQGRAGADGPGAEQSLASSLGRKCSNCGKIGHNSRTCLEHRDRTASTGQEATGEVIHQEAERYRQQIAERGREEGDGAASDDSTGGNHREARKKGVAWTEEEHRLFLLGLQKLGKGDWRGISRHYVQTRSPTQVASHAQKYFIRQSFAGKRKRRASLFDLVPDNKVGETTSLRFQQKQQVKPDARAMQTQMEVPQQPNSVLPGVPQGAGAFALACWYQAMLAQQNPAAFMQAMFGQRSQGQFGLPPPFAPMMAAGEGWVPPMMVQQPGFSPLGSQQPGLLPGQVLATAYLAQQQQIAAAIAMGAMGFDPELAGHDGNVVSNPGKPVAGALQNSLHQNTALSQEPMRVKNEPKCAEGKQVSALAQLGKIAANEVWERDNPFHSENVGNSIVVRPQAQKARPVQSFGEMPSYMVGNQEMPSVIGGSSMESQNTSRLLPAEVSCSTNGGLAHDEMSASKSSKLSSQDNVTPWNASGSNQYGNSLLDVPGIRRTSRASATV